MSTQCEVTAKRAVGAPMSVFERYLTLWVFVCIVAGILVGQFLPGVSQAVGRRFHHPSDSQLFPSV
jgi:ACR3 family arsenite transporter